MRLCGACPLASDEFILSFPLPALAAPPTHRAPVYDGAKAVTNQRAAKLKMRRGRRRECVAADLSCGVGWEPQSGAGEDDGGRSGGESFAESFLRACRVDRNEALGELEKHRRVVDTHERDEKEVKSRSRGQRMRNCAESWQRRQPVDVLAMHVGSVPLVGQLCCVGGCDQIAVVHCIECDIGEALLAGSGMLCGEHDSSKHSYCCHMREVWQGGLQRYLMPTEAVSRDLKLVSRASPALHLLQFCIHNYSCIRRCCGSAVCSPAGVPALRIHRRNGDAPARAGARSGFDGYCLTRARSWAPTPELLVYKVQSLRVSRGALHYARGRLRCPTHFCLLSSTKT